MWRRGGWGFGFGEVLVIVLGWGGEGGWVGW